MPFFSIILPAYNRANWLKFSIKSVLNQSFTDFELIIIDDGSTDETKNVVASFKDERIRYVYQENQERCIARNNGIILAQGNFICFLDSDDRYLPWHLETFYQVLSQIKFQNAVLFTNFEVYKIVNEPEFHRIENDYHKYAHDDKITYKHLSSKEAFKWSVLQPIVCMRWCVSRELIKKNLFNPAFTFGEDTELFARLIVVADSVIHIERVTTILSEHAARTVNQNNELSYKKYLALIDYVFAHNPLAKEQLKLKDVCYHNNYLGLSHHLIQKKEIIKALKILLKSFRLFPFSNVKEKIALFSLCLKQSIIKH